jgi:menaquinol-cytochrome c reductase iron-sulfur subunit
MPDENKNRRGFLDLLTKGILTVLGVFVAAPAVAFVFSPLWKKRETAAPDAGFSDAGPVPHQRAGEWALVNVEVVRRDGWEESRIRRSVYVRRSGEGDREFTVFSPICPHLGCSVMWQEKTDKFLCPCHKAVYTSDGDVESGPPPRGMDPLECRVRDGRLWVRWQDFKNGSPERTPVGV